MNILPSEQFEATDVDAGDQDNRCAGVDILNEVGDKGHAEIGFAAAHRRPLGVHRHFDVADISRAFGAQQLLAHILRSDADDRGLVDPYGRGLECAFRAQRRRRENEAGGAGQGQGGQEAASGLNHRHPNPPFPRRVVKPSARA